MDIANFVSLKTGILSSESFVYMHNLLYKNVPAFKLRKNQIGPYFKALSKDKKNIGDNLGCILANAYGSLVKKYIPFDDALKQLISSYFGHNQSTVVLKEIDTKPFNSRLGTRSERHSEQKST